MTKKRCISCHQYFEAVKTYPGKTILLPWCSPQCGFDRAKVLEEKKEKAKRKEWRVEKQKTLERIETKNWWEAKKLQPLINNIARIIDFGLPCIAREQYGKIDGGHFKAVKGSEIIRFNLHNIHRQSAQSNRHYDGDTALFREGIIRDYGWEYLALVDQLKFIYRAGNLWTKQDIIEAVPRARAIRNRLKKEITEIQTPRQRILLRNLVNAEMGFYTKE